jgi:hypothetical protein
MADPYTIPSLNNTGIDVALVNIAQQVPIFIPMFLVFIWCLVFFNGFLKQKRESSTGGDAALWATVAGVVTSIVASILSMKAGLMNPGILATVIVVTIASGIWLFTSQDRQ